MKHRYTAIIAASRNSPSTSKAPRLAHETQFPVLQFGVIIMLCLGLSVSAQALTVRWASTSNRIYITGPGSATLSDIKAARPTVPLDQVASGVWHLQANLQIEQGATLVLHGQSIGGDVNELRLKSNNALDANSWIAITADYGNIDIQNTRITSWDEAVNGPDVEYQTYKRAFIRVRSSLGADGVSPLESRMDIVNSDIGYLGFNAAESYGLAWKVIGNQPNLYDLVDVRGNILNSRIHHNYYGFYTFGGFEMQWIGNEVDHNAGYGIDPHDDSDSLLIENNFVHHNGNHGIIASKRCDHVIIRNNRCEFNSGNGIMLHRSSDYALIEDNECLNNSDAGVALFDSNNSVVRNNHLQFNDYGIRLSVGSANNRIENNTINGNDRNGFYLYRGTDPPHEGDDGRPKFNQFANNAVHNNGSEGIKLQDSDFNVFAGNEFVANNVSFKFERGRENQLQGNIIPSDVTVQITGSSEVASTLWFENQSRIRLAIDGFSNAGFVDANGLVFDPEEDNLWTTTTVAGTLLHLASAEIGSSSIVITRNLRVVPSSGTALVNPTLWNLAGNSNKAWLVKASSNTQSINFGVGDLASNTAYTVFKNGIPLSSGTSDNFGTFSFTDIPGSTASIHYQVNPAAGPASSRPANSNLRRPWIAKLKAAP